jgi:hypothetical protein
MITDNKRDSETVSNVFGDLLTICQKYSLTPPVFTFEPTTGPAHNPTFVCTSRFGEFTDQGIGKTKKSAKNQAALKSLQRLRGQDQTTTTKTLSIKEISLAAIPENHDLTIRPLSTSTPIMLTPPTTPLRNNCQKTVFKNVNSFEMFKKSPKTFIRNLLTKDFEFKSNVDYVRKLDILSREQHFDVSYRYNVWDEPMIPGWVLEK